MPVLLVKLMALAQVSPLPEVLNVAVTLRAAVIDTVQLPAPEHAPLQPPNVEPLAGVAESDTDVPLEKFAAQVLPQLIPEGVEVTVPLPLPIFVTLSE